MKLSKEVILNLGKQVYMGLSEQEIEELSESVGTIAEKTQVLNELDTSDIKPDIAVLDGFYNVFRKDNVVPYDEKICDVIKIPKVM